MGIGTGGIPTTENIPEKTEKLGCPTDNLPDNRFFKKLNFIVFMVGHPNISVVSSILSVVGIPPVPMPIPEEIQLLMYAAKIDLKCLKNQL